MSLFLAYVRASTSDQQITLRSQEEQLRAWATAFGHEAEVHVESGVSGTVAPAERPVLSTLLERLDAGDAQGLVAIKLDRLSRNTRDVIDLVERADEHGWALVCKNDSFDTASPTGRFVVRLFASLAELERDLIGERTSAALDQLRREGKRYSGEAPWGYRFVDGAVIQNEHEQRVATLLSTCDDLNRTTATEAAATIQHYEGDHPRLHRPWNREMIYALRKSLAKRRSA